MEINLDEFKAPGKTNTRVSTGQSFSGIKFRDKMFILSNELFDKIGLSTQALKVMINPTSKQVALVPVANDEGNIFKRTDKTGVDKSKGFTSSVIEAALKETSLLVGTNPKENQYLDLATATTKAGAIVYVIIAGGGQKKKNDVAPVANTESTQPVGDINGDTTASTTIAPAEVPDELNEVEDHVESSEPADNEFDEQF